MSRFVIHGGRPLSGEIRASGSKNAVLPMIAAALLTDEEVVSYANDTPLAFSQFGAPTWYGFVERSRSVALQASYRFGE